MMDIFNATWNWYWGWVHGEIPRDFRNAWEFGQVRLCLLQAIGDRASEPVLLKA